MPNVGKIISGVAKAVSKSSGKSVAKAVKKKAAESTTKKALKAAQGPSKAPKGYKMDTAGRADVKRLVEQGYYSKVAGQYFKLTPQEAAKYVTEARKSSMNASRTRAEGGVSAAPKNNISRSGRKANTSGLNYKAAKKGK
jgi:hypothetical protein